MNGWDFGILWGAGRAVLDGRDPYTVAFFYYPLPVAYLFATLAVLPQTVAFWAWVLANASVLILHFRKDFWKWALYIPVLHFLSSGQVDLAMWWLATKMNRRWRGALLGAILTLKPQAAVVLLPWHLLDWLKNDRKNLLRWALSAGALWGLPLLWRPGWLLEWRRSLPPFSLASARNAPGLFSLTGLTPSLWPVLALVAVAVFVWGVRQSESMARGAATFAAPIGLFYDTLFLMGCAPWWLLVPVSWLATLLTLLTKSFAPFIGMPCVVMAWQYWCRRNRTGDLP